MAVLIFSWLVVAFVFVLVAHSLVPDDGHIDVDVTLVLGMTGALVLSGLCNFIVDQPPWGAHIAGLAGLVTGALGGVAVGAIGQRRNHERAQEIASRKVS